MFMFLDRTEAGEELAAKLSDNPLIKAVTEDELLVLSIPRGGVIVGKAVAQALHCVHEMVAVKKIGFPGQTELAIGAMAEDGTLVFNPHLADWLEPEDENIVPIIDRVRIQIEAYVQKFRQGRALNLQTKLVIMVDDGIATGETMKAAVIWSRTQHPQKVIVAVPVCSPQAAIELKKYVDEFVCLAVPSRFRAVGQFYWDFDQVSDEEVLECLSQRTTRSGQQQSEPVSPTTKEAIEN